MAGTMQPESFRETSIYLNQLHNEIIDLRKDVEENRADTAATLARMEAALSNQLHELKREIQDEKREREATKIQRNFLIISAFVAPIIVSFFVSAAGFGK
jgi:uncharacterized protein (UPF0305 family)